MPHKAGANLESKGGVVIQGTADFEGGTAEHWVTLRDTTPPKKESFLRDLANLHPHPSAAERFYAKHNQFFVVWNYTPDAARPLVLEKLSQLAAAARRVWDEQRPAWRDWYAYELRRKFHTEVAAALVPAIALRPPLDLAFDNAARFLQENLQRARHCQNPDCSAPYFFSTSRRPKKFCDEDCARPAELAAKRRSWDKHKTKWSKKK